jgi:glycerol kinase
MGDTRESKRQRIHGEYAATNGDVPEEWFIGSIDQGTTSSRFIIFNRWADPIASHQIEFDNHYPHSGYITPHVPVRLPSQKTLSGGRKY